MNRVRNGEGGGWHARQAHAEQNIGLIEKSALSIHALSNPLFTRISLFSSCTYSTSVSVGCLLITEEIQCVCMHWVICDKLQQNRRSGEIHTGSALPVLTTFKLLSIQSICFQLHTSGTYHLQMGGSFPSCVRVAVGGFIRASFVGCFCNTSPCFLRIHHTPATTQMFICLKYKYGHTGA